MMHYYQPAQPAQGRYPPELMQGPAAREHRALCALHEFYQSEDYQWLNYNRVEPLLFTQHGWLWQGASEFLDAQASNRLLDSMMVQPSVSDRTEAQLAGALHLGSRTGVNTRSNVVSMACMLSPTRVTRIVLALGVPCFVTLHATGTEASKDLVYRHVRKEFLLGLANAVVKRGHDLGLGKDVATYVKGE